jgi:hypothetical protein
MDWVHKPTEYSISMVDNETRKVLDENHWPVVPCIGDEIETRGLGRYKVVGRQFVLDSLLTIDVELELILE